MSNKTTILILDDEAQIRRLLQITLASDGYQILEASSAKVGIQMASQNTPDLILLDLGLPDTNGHEVLKHLREWYSNPIIIISVQHEEQDIVRALDAGASDYIIKPFRTGELLARVRSALRKSQKEHNTSTLEFSGLFIDFANRVVRKNGISLKLTATEYALLALLIKNEGNVLTHPYLLREIWGHSHEQESQYLRVFIAQLRKKIEDDPNRPRHIVTESGIGYRFVGTPL